MKQIYLFFMLVTSMTVCMDMDMGEADTQTGVYLEKKKQLLFAYKVTKLCTVTIEFIEKDLASDNIGHQKRFTAQQLSKKKRSQKKEFSEQDIIKEIEAFTQNPDKYDSSPDISKPTQWELEEKLKKFEEQSNNNDIKSNEQ